MRLKICKDEERGFFFRVNEGKPAGQGAWKLIKNSPEGTIIFFSTSFSSLSLSLNYYIRFVD